MRVDETVVVAAPIERVWPVVRDPSRAARYAEDFIRWRLLGEQATGCGARYRLHMQVGSALIGGIVEIVEDDAPHDMAWASVTGVDHRGRWRLRALDDGRTRVTFRLSYQTPGGLVSVVVDRLAAPLVRRNLRRMLSALRDDLERPRPAHPARAGT